jgi:flagellar hook-associated protein 2
MSTSSSINLLSSSIDVGTIVDNLIKADSAPITNMQSNVTTLQSKVSAFQSLNTKLSTLTSNLNGILFGSMDDPLLKPSSFADRLSRSIFNQCKATSSDENTVTATASNATGGTYSITVNNLATAQSLASDGFAGATSDIGTGTITFTKGGHYYTVTIDSSNATLNGACNAINKSGAGITASVVNDGSTSTPYRLLITANDTGTANSVVVTENLSDGAALNIATIAGQEAKDASFTVNGVDIKKSSNTISDVINGLTFTLKNKTNTPVTLAVDKDLDSIVKSFNTFIAAYNDINTFISSQFTYNGTTKKAGALSGDSTLRSIQNTLRSQIAQPASNQLSSLSITGQAGIEFNRDGSLSLDEGKLRSALSGNFNGIAALFLGENSSGIFSTLQSQLDSITDPLSGPIQNATDSLNKNIKSINKSISAYQARLDVEKQLLTDQYNQADEALRMLTVNQASLTAQIDKLS